MNIIGRGGKPTKPTPNTLVLKYYGITLIFIYVELIPGEYEYSYYKVTQDS